MKPDRSILRSFIALTIALLTIVLTPVCQAAVPEQLFIKGPPPVSLPAAAQYFVDSETQKNKLSSRSNQPFWIEHLEIPLSALKEFRLPILDPAIYQSLVFKKDGKKYVRWLLNPEDTSYGKELRTMLASMGIRYQEGRRFVGYLTASRSCIIQDPESGVVFSAKSSTNETGGQWKEKRETAQEARAATLMTEYLLKNEPRNQSDVLRFVPEPLAFTFEAANQGMVIRQYSHFNDPKQNLRLIPFFAAVHETEGRRIAQLNGSDNPLQFWADHLVKPTGTALGELVINYGVILISAHAQNFLVEVDENDRPTGRIFIRDFVDSKPQADIMELRDGGSKVQEFYEHLGHLQPAHKPIRNLISVAFNVFKNGVGPSWAFNPNYYHRWDLIFYHYAAVALAQPFQKLGSVPKSGITYPDESYWTLQVDVTDDSAFLALLAQIRESGKVEVRKCQALFQ